MVLNDYYSSTKLYGQVLRVCTFFVRSVGAASVQVYNRRTTATRPRRACNRATAALPCYQCLSLHVCNVAR